MTNIPTPAPTHLINTYNHVNLSVSHGQGVRFWDTLGNEYLDALSGIAVNTVGHNHPVLVAALQDQISKVIHSSNYYRVPGQEQLAAKLAALSGLDKAFFCNSGLEANEACLKLARKLGNDRGYKNPKVIVCEQAFHGRSLATLSATGNPSIHAGFYPLIDGFVRVPLNDINALKEVIDNEHEVSALFFEVIQGEGGIHPTRLEYLRQVRQFCDANNILLMLDEVQCGMGRTGKWFAHQWAGIKPDVIALAKGLASGVPIGAVITGPKASEIFQPGNHGTTFGGNPLAMRAALTTIQIIEDEKLLENALNVGQFLLNELHQILDDVQGVREIRGAGLMIGIELDRPCGALLQKAADNGLLISVTAGNVVRLLPALIFTQNDANALLKRLCPLITDFLS